MLAPGGVLVVAVPNAGSLQARLLGERWLALDLPRHLVHLPAEALLERLRSLGLTVERVSFWRGGQVVFGWLHGLVGALPGRPDLYDAIRRPEARSRPISARSARAGPRRGARCWRRSPRSGLRRRSPHGAAGRVLRRGPPCLSRPPGKVIVVMPAMNAAATLGQTVGSIPRDWVDEVLLVDDHSTDETIALARELPLHLVWHPHNAGYGANQKTCYLEALQRDADAIVMLHPDGQYEPGLIPQHGRADPDRQRPTWCSALASPSRAGAAPTACRAGSTWPTER